MKAFVLKWGQKIWPLFSPYFTKKRIYGLMEKWAVKIVLNSMKVTSGFPVFLLSQIASYEFKKYLIPFFNKLIRNGLLIYDTQKGELIAKRMDDASEENDQEAYNDAWFDMFK
ncbi:MAG: hypothetical protein KAS32_31260 [Candidatus Peribacteraceae bacterium]|nr:hypothetical protein [Candidatus Peribacteraceae bacterium]